MLKPGMILCDRYEILEVVGAGGMSIVYKARCHRLNRNVAIKVLKPEFSNDKNFVTKFRIEAQASAGLTHPNIVNVFDVYDDEEINFIVMELVDGITLKEFIAQNGRLPMDRAIDFAIQIASGLEAAHESHIIHRDIKPQNIIVSRNGNIKVTDFGIAKAATSNTLTSGAMGSVHYISPEQARGGYSDERSDIYSLGITMFEMVTGRVPFEGDNNVSVALMHIQSDIIPPRQYYPDIYSSFEKVIMKATQKKPERRYLTASALIADLRRVQNNPNIDIVVAPTAITNSPTQEWSKEEVKAIRDGSAYKDPYVDSQLNTFGGIQNPVAEAPASGGISQIQLQNSRLNQLLDDTMEDEYDSYYEDEPEQPRPPKGSIKKIQDDYEEPEYEDDSDIDPGLRKAVTIAAIAAAGVLVIILVVVLGNSMGWFKKSDKKENPKATEAKIKELVMEEVVDYSEQSAKTILADAGFTNVKVVYENNQDVQEGYVFEQNYKAGDVVSADTEIIIKVSSGAKLVDIPQTTGLSDEQACKILAEAGFEIRHSYEFSEDVEKDYVIEQDPEYGSQAPEGSTVVITVSNGSEKKEVSVPNLKGLTEDEARAALLELKLTPGTVGQEFSDTVAAGQVINQSIVYGTKATEGDTIDFVISKGAEEKKITYTANITGTATCNDSTMDGQAVTVQVRLDGITVSEQTITVIAGTPNSVSGTKPGLEFQTGKPDIVIIDAGGNNVTASFTCTSSVTFSEVAETAQ